ncbi:MAG TPA: NAD-dependent epimerase/dehydratase family protein [Burkholderiales bacterium]|nr:NAD-dependent epimerase/dehydratase family protein [Burkholderiales bacterium]
MKVAITGASGYVGSLLVRAHAARGDAVHALAREAAAVPAVPGVTPYVADLGAPADVPDTFFEGAAVLYHCAAEIAREEVMQAVNVEATRALLTRARGAVGHWVQLSSLSVYGTPRAGIIDEESPASPRTRYAQTKLDAEALVADLGRGAFTCTIVRPATIVGPGMRNQSLRALIDAVGRGRFRFIGAPGALFNGVHEEDMVEALMLYATRPEAHGRTYNISEDVPIERLIDAIASALGHPGQPGRIPEGLARCAAKISRLVPAFPLTPARVDALTSRVEYRSARIERELGYRPRKSVEEAVRELAARRRTGAS